MAQQIINLGAAPNDGGGDPFRVGGDKINDNFSELYADIVTIDAFIANPSAGRFTGTGQNDGAFLATRTLTGSANAHGFKDDTVFSRDTFAYNSFDGAMVMEGPNLDFDHAVSFQSRIEVDNSGGTLINLWGLYNAHTVTAGAVTNAFGVYCLDAAGAGTITNQYGVYVDEQTKGSTLNYAIYTQGTTPSLFGGNVQVQGDFSVSDATKGIYIGNGLDGTWRFIISGDNLLIQQREAGTYNTKSTISGA